MAETYDQNGDPIDSNDDSGFNQDAVIEFLDKGRTMYELVDKKIGVGPAALLLGVGLTGFGIFKVYSSITNSNK